MLEHKNYSNINTARRVFKSCCKNIKLLKIITTLKVLYIFYKNNKFMKVFLHKNYIPPLELGKKIFPTPFYYLFSSINSVKEMAFYKFNIPTFLSENRLTYLHIIDIYPYKLSNLGKDGAP